MVDVRFDGLGASEETNEEATTQDHAGSRKRVPGCRARRVLGAQKDFQDQKGRLQEEVENLGHRVLFYPKFHCELNFIRTLLLVSSELVGMPGKIVASVGSTD